MHYTVADIVLDIVQNSIEAGSELITVDFLEKDTVLTICIGDNGKGMSEEELSRVKDPFYSNENKHVHRKVGLGIPFLIQACEACGGEFDITSDQEVGTSVFFTFNLSHVDCPPLGNMVGTFVSMMNFSNTYELQVYRTKNDKAYRVSRSELLDALGDIHSAASLQLTKQFFISQEEEL